MKTYSADKTHVYTPNLIEATISLGFGIYVRRNLVVDGIFCPPEDDLRSRAKYCMVVLLGGKEIVARMEDNPPNEVPVPAKVFLPARRGQRRNQFFTRLGEEQAEVLNLEAIMHFLASQKDPYDSLLAKDIAKARI